MALVNTRVVRRSNALLHDAYGPDFHYNEYAQAKGSLSLSHTHTHSLSSSVAPRSIWRLRAYPRASLGPLMAILFTVVLFIFGILLQFRLTREHVLKKILPAPGEGPRYSLSLVTRPSHNHTH